MITVRRRIFVILRRLAFGWGTVRKRLFRAGGGCSDVFGLFADDRGRIVFELGGRLTNRLAWCCWL